MSITLSNKCQHDDSKWDDAIRDAKEEIRALSRHKARLQQAIRIFRENKRERLQWPSGEPQRKSK